MGGDVGLASIMKGTCHVDAKLNAAIGAAASVLAQQRFCEAQYTSHSSLES